MSRGRTGINLSSLSDHVPAAATDPLYGTGPSLYAHTGPLATGLTSVHAHSHTLRAPGPFINTVLTTSTPDSAGGRALSTNLGNNTVHASAPGPAFTPATREAGSSSASTILNPPHLTAPYKGPAAVYAGSSNSVASGSPGKTYTHDIRPPGPRTTSTLF
jgi:hypothetical protein